MFAVSSVIQDRDKVQEVYSGRPGCACGCRGEYYKKGEVATRRFENVLTRAWHRIEESEGTIMQGNQIGSNGRWISIENENRVYTIYYAV